MMIPCPGPPACLSSMPHLHHSDGMIEYRVPALNYRFPVPVYRPQYAVPGCSCGVDKRDPLGLEDHADDCTMRQPDDRALRARVRQLEAKAPRPGGGALVAALIEQHPLVRELRAKVEEQRDQVAELERKVAELWRRSM